LTTTGPLGAVVLEPDLVWAVVAHATEAIAAADTKTRIIAVISSLLACNVHDVYVTDSDGSCLCNVEQVSILSLDGLRLSALLRAASAATVAPFSL
jgi:hypothetical protein